MDYDKFYAETNKELFEKNKLPEDYFTGGRDYQQYIALMAISFLRSCVAKGLIEAPGGSGKSFCLAYIAKWFIEHTQKDVLIYTDSPSVTFENHNKFAIISKYTGHHASLLSGTLNEHCLKHRVIYGSTDTVELWLEKIAEKKNIGLILKDEADESLDKTKRIVSFFEEKSITDGKPLLRFIGVTATPHHGKNGRIFKIDENGNSLSEKQAIEPYFDKLIVRLLPYEMIERGYLNPPKLPEITVSYDTSKLVLKDDQEDYTATQLKSITEQNGKTEQIIPYVLENSKDGTGTLWFCADKKHAIFVQSFIEKNYPHRKVGLVVSGGKGNKIDWFKKMNQLEVTDLVNISIIQRGVDLPPVSDLVFLTKHGSLEKFAQSLLRGTRLCEQITVKRNGQETTIQVGKKFFRVWDFAGNIEQHCIDGDLFNLNIVVRKPKKPAPQIQVECPLCSFIQDANLDEECKNMKWNKHGYALDKGVTLDFPVHTLQRCQNNKLSKFGVEQCSYKWINNTKICPHCETENSRSQRYCKSCGTPLVDLEKNLSLQHAGFTPLYKEYQPAEVFSYYAETKRFGEIRIIYTISTGEKIEQILNIHDGAANNANTVLKSILKSDYEYINTRRKKIEDDNQPVFQSMNDMLNPPIQLTEDAIKWINGLISKQGMNAQAIVKSINDSHLYATDEAISFIYRSMKTYNETGADINYCARTVNKINFSLNRVKAIKFKKTDSKKSNFTVEVTNCTPDFFAKVALPAYANQVDELTSKFLRDNFILFNKVQDGCFKVGNKFLYPATGTVIFSDNSVMYGNEVMILKWLRS